MTAHEGSRAPTLHVAILGAGAVGLTLATFLRAAGQRVTLLTRTGQSSELPLPLRLDDEIGQRQLQLTAGDVSVLAAGALSEPVDHLIVCTRAEQLDAALMLLRRLPSGVPITNAAATLADPLACARSAGLPHPILQLGVGFAAWPVAPRHYRVFALSPPGPVLAPLVVGAGPAARELAWLLATAGFPQAQAAPRRLFTWVFRGAVALEIPWMLAYRQAGWELEALWADADLRARCAKAMREAAQAVQGAGPLSVCAGWLPVAGYRWLVRRRCLRASAGYQEVWRHHGPKTDEQLHWLVRQLREQARRPMSALEALCAVS